MLILAAQSEEPVSSVVLLAQHLEASNLQDFWAATNSCKDTIKQGEGGKLTPGIVVSTRADHPMRKPGKGGGDAWSRWCVQGHNETK